jgi:hypothetical protein
LIHAIRSDSGFQLKSVSLDTETGQFSVSLAEATPEQLVDYGLERHSRSSHFLSKQFCRLWIKGQSCSDDLSVGQEMRDVRNALKASNRLKAQAYGEGLAEEGGRGLSAGVAFVFQKAHGL